MCCWWLDVSAITAGFAITAIAAYKCIPCDIIVITIATIATIAYGTADVAAPAIIDVSASLPTVVLLVPLSSLPLLALLMALLMLL